MNWIDRFDGLAALDGPARDRLLDRTRILRVSAGATVFAPGSVPDHMLLLLSGTVRVQQVSENGREIVLYRVRTGESCVLTTACLLADEAYSAEAIAETESVAAAIPRPLFDEMVGDAPVFRRFVFDAYSHRIADLFMTIEEVAFRRMDIRLAGKLLELAEGSVVPATHQRLAAELGTAREVVSRQLSEFQRRGWIAQSRGTIALVDRDSLVSLAE